MYDRLTRAKFFVKKLRLVSVPSTLLKITQAQEQLKFLQLKRTPGCPISWLTVFKKLDIANPEQEIEKSFKEQAQLKKMEIMSQIEVMKALKAAGIDPSILMGGGQEGGHGGSGGKSGGQHGGGRPPSGQRQPRISQKGAAGGVPRQVVKES
jgi:hypothetical protein